MKIYKTDKEKFLSLKKFIYSCLFVSVFSLILFSYGDLKEFDGFFELPGGMEFGMSLNSTTTRDPMLH